MNIERNGYFTGKRCTREATKVVTFNAGTGNEDARVCCTQHANKLMRIVSTVPQTIEEI